MKDLLSVGEVQQPRRVHRARALPDHLPCHARRRAVHQNDLADGEGVGLAALQRVRSNPVAVRAVGCKRVIRALVDQVDAADLDAVYGLVHLPGDGRAHGGVAGQIKGFSEAGSDVICRNASSLDLACVHRSCRQLVRGDRTGSDVIGKNRRGSDFIGGNGSGDDAVCGDGALGE